MQLSFVISGTLHWPLGAYTEPFRYLPDVACLLVGD